MELTVRYLTQQYASVYLFPHYTVTLTNQKGETPREVAIRFSSTGCIAILAPHTPHLGTKGEWEGEEAELDQPSGISVGRAKERVEKLMEALQTAKLRFRELGGELPEDREIELLKAEHQKYAFTKFLHLMACMIC